MPEAVPASDEVGQLIGGALANGIVIYSRIEVLWIIYQAKRIVIITVAIANLGGGVAVL